MSLQGVGDAVLVLEDQHVAGDPGVTLGLPSRSPPIQVPKVSGRALGGQLDADALQLGGEVVEHVAATASACRSSR